MNVVQSVSEMIHHYCFLVGEEGVCVGGGGGGGGRVFVVANAFKSVIKKLEMGTSIFLNVFVQDCSLFPTGCDL